MTNEAESIARAVVKEIESLEKAVVTTVEDVTGTATINGFGTCFGSGFGGIDKGKEDN